MIHIRVAKLGDIGNNMFQYMLARTIQERFRNSRVSGVSIPMFGLNIPTLAFNPIYSVETGKGKHIINIDQIVSSVNASVDTEIVVNSFAMRVEYYRQWDYIAGLFVDQNESMYPVFDDRHIVINVRGKEIWKAVHPDYVPVPLRFYKEVIKQSGRKPVFMGQIENNDYCSALGTMFPDATFMPSQGASFDFGLMRAAKCVIPSVSSFSWLATWLARNATEIHMPLLGFFNPQQRNDVNLKPEADERYSFHNFPVRKWRGTPEDIEFVMSLS